MFLSYPHVYACVYAKDNIYSFYMDKKSVNKVRVFYSVTVEQRKKIKEIAIKNIVSESTIIRNLIDGKKIVYK